MGLRLKMNVAKYGQLKTITFTRLTRVKIIKSRDLGSIRSAAFDFLNMTSLQAYRK